jgi:hypothetical protein
MKRSIMLLLFLAVVCWSIPSNKAYAIPTGANTFSSVGLNWLSPVWSLEVSYDSMWTALAEPSSDYFGFRLATKGEVAGLAEALGAEQELPYVELDFEQEMQTAAESSAIEDCFKGFVLDDLNDVLTYGVDLSLADISQVGILFTSEKNIPYPRIGSWLVTIESSPVPEPSTIILLGSGLLGLGWYGRKRKKA